MQLRSGERSILATFTLPEQAHACQAALRAAGFDVIQIDAVPSRSEDALTHVPQVEWGRLGYQADVLDDKWTAASAWDHDNGLIWGESWLLTAVVPEEAAGRALRIIREQGGRL